MVAGTILAAGAIFGIALRVGGWSAVDDTWVGMVALLALLGGLMVSLAAFGAALTVAIRHQRWAPLWLPLLVFPVILTFLVVGELFWWE